MKLYYVTCYIGTVDICVKDLKYFSFYPRSKFFSSLTKIPDPHQ
jgi:hypothetical protein